MRILAIDPGYERLGIAVLEKLPKQKETLLYSDCFFTSKKLSHPQRLELVGKEIEKIIKDYSPTQLSIEKLFFSKNVTTALPVAEARGVILFQCAAYGLEIAEYNPVDVKIAVTGYGKSDKDHIIAMVPKLIAISKSIKYDDEYDAIAIGLTHFAHSRASYPQK